MNAELKLWMNSWQSVRTALHIPDVESSDIWFSEFCLMSCSELKFLERHFHCAFQAVGFLHAHTMCMHSLDLSNHSFHDTARW